MLRKLRRLFIAISALGYAFLGGGPSLWALGLEAQPSCAVMGCTCKMAHGTATCPFCAALARKFPQLLHPTRPLGCEMRQSPLSPLEAGSAQRSLPGQQPHTLAGAGPRFHLEQGRALSFPSPRGLSSDPQPPSPFPD
jgi:hypothetical protein